jgi:hypothetical protein
MKYIGLILLVILLSFLNTLKAQTASSTPVSKYYSTMLNEKLAAGKHPASADHSGLLPDESKLPKKVIDLAKDAHVYTGANPDKKLAGNNRIDVQAIKSRNEKWITKKQPG